MHHAAQAGQRMLVGQAHGLVLVQHAPRDQGRLCVRGVTDQRRGRAAGRNVQVHALAANDIALVHGVARTTVLTQIAATRTRTAFPACARCWAMISRMPQLAPLMGVVH